MNRRFSKTLLSFNAILGTIAAAAPAIANGLHLLPLTPHQQIVGGAILSGITSVYSAMTDATKPVTSAARAMPQGADGPEETKP